MLGPSPDLRGPTATAHPGFRRPVHPRPAAGPDAAMPRSDTGTRRSDALKMLRRANETWSSPHGAVLRGLLAAAADDPELLALMRERSGADTMDGAWLTMLELVRPGPPPRAAAPRLGATPSPGPSPAPAPPPSPGPPRAPRHQQHPRHPRALRHQEPRARARAAGEVARPRARRRRHPRAHGRRPPRRCFSLPSTRCAPSPRSSTTRWSRPWRRCCCHPSAATGLTSRLRSLLVMTHFRGW
jgi:hypothetical protein